MSIGAQLQSTSFGIVCVTPENVEKPWLTFEAGALSKSMSAGKVVPYLIEMDETHLLRNPLSMFQSKRADEKGTWDLIESINNSLDGPLSPDILKDAFAKYWHQLQLALKHLPLAQEEPAPPPTSDFVLADILATVLTIERYVIKRPPVRRIVEGHLSVEKPPPSPLEKQPDVDWAEDDVSTVTIGPPES